MRVQNRTAYKYKLHTWEEMYLSGLSQTDISRLLNIPMRERGII